MRVRSAMVVIVLVASCTSVEPSSEPSASITFGDAEIGGYRLDYECLGAGATTIVLEAGYDTGGTSAFSVIIPRLADIARVCTYDRAGTGSSDDRPPAEARGLTSLDQARELHALLAAAGLGPPYVLVAHSYGGFVSRLFAATYRDEVQALVLIESSHEDEVPAYRRYYGDDPEGDRIDGGDPLDMGATTRALRGAARDLGAIPVIVIRAQTYEDVLSETLWRRTQADLATLSTDGMEIEALHSGHLVQDDNPTVVVAAVRAAVRAVTSGEALVPCEQVIDGVEARCLH